MFPLSIKFNDGRRNNPIKFRAIEILIREHKRFGVPPGTILGPLLFLLYINDLPNCLMHSQPRMYADDTSITYANNDVEEIERCVNIDLDRIRIWLAANKLTLNTTKTEFLLIGSRQRLSTLERNPVIEINKFPIKHVSTSKSLGVHIDGNLSWECHINEISKKVASGISAIKRIRYFLPFEILYLTYTIHWYSHTLITVM